MKTIYVVGDIDWESYKNFCIDMDEAESKNKGKQIEIHLASDGGNAHAALAFSSRMRLSENRICVTAAGYVASAATLILASGDLRRLTRESWVMVHEEQGELVGSVTELETETAQLRRMEFQWAALLWRKSNTSAKDWGEMHKQTKYLSANECLELGLVDEVI